MRGIEKIREFLTHPSGIPFTIFAIILALMTFFSIILLIKSGRFK
jgi:hypothetical protein